MADQKKQAPAPRSTEITDLPETGDAGVKGGAMIVPCVQPGQNRELGPIVKATIIPCVRPPR